ncbi:MAG: YggT family protein [Cetobacterium sp.]|uniref:YggT family protein n=1 Tax=Cetobacterium ceti TaxID=180163 RepID=A0A1T4JZF1_9FUSO|nr:YggT family protein [Cetobacterium ceti]MCJ8343559.1 YggT family protein [Cetobacterium sp.]SJZ35570.1 YggT family protein [Cetobacterium ceti]
MYSIYGIINLIFQILNILIFIRIVLSWLAPMTRNEFTDVVYGITEPILRPFRVLIPIGAGRIDISPILAYLALKILRFVIFYLLSILF